MTTHPLAGKPASKDFLVDVDELRKEYYARKPDIADQVQRISSGTSGHRGSSLRGAFTEEVYKLYAESFRGDISKNGSTLHCLAQRVAL